MRLEKIAEILRITAHNLYRHADFSFKDKLDSPRVGDWVYETSTVYDRAKDFISVGVLTQIALEPVDYGDYVWTEEVDGGPHPKETVYYIELLNGETQRWTNARFSQIPRHISF